MEPIQLLRGKLFHKRIQSDWKGTIEGKIVRPEFSINLKLNSGIQIQTHSRRGRIDIFVDKMEDFVTIIEIKSTDWDKINSQNIKKLLAAHSRQLFKYIDKFLDIDQSNVCAAIIYPKSPILKGLKDIIENYFNENSLQIIWYDQ